MTRTYALLLTLLFSLGISAQNYTSNHRRLARMVDDMMELTSNVVDEVMTFGKAKKIQAQVDELESEWRKSSRYLARLDGPDEAALVETIGIAMGQLVNISTDSLKTWYSADARDSYGHTYVRRTGVLFAQATAALEAYASRYEVDDRGMKSTDRFEAQLDLLSYTAEMKRGANTVDSLVAFISGEIPTTDIDALVGAQKELVKELSRHIRGYGDELFYNGQTELHEAYQKYYFELLELTSADLLADLTKMRYDLIEYNAIESSTERSALKTLSYFDNELKLLNKREARFVARNLPPAPRD